MFKQYWGLLFMGVLLCNACEEKPPFIDFTEQAGLSDTTYISGTIPAPQHKAVLLEDITGVRCSGCPNAAIEANNILIAKTEDSVVVVALYSADYLGHFTAPWDGFPVVNSKFAGQIVTSLGVPGGVPYGYVDRHKFGTQSVRFQSHGTWGNLVNERLKLSTPVNIVINKALIGRKLTIDLNLSYTESIGEKHKYALYLTESNIISKQRMLTYDNDNYVHNHVLRHAFGLALGTSLNASLVPGRVFERKVSYEIPAEYNLEHLHVICVVSQTDTEEVVNVRQINLK